MNRLIFIEHPPVPVPIALEGRGEGWYCVTYVSPVGSGRGQQVGQQFGIDCADTSDLRPAYVGKYMVCGMIDISEIQLRQPRTIAEHTLSGGAPLMYSACTCELVPLQ